MDPATGLIVAMFDAAEPMLRDSNLVGQRLGPSGSLNAAPRFLADLCKAVLEAGTATVHVDAPAGRLNIEATVLRPRSAPEQADDQILMTLRHETPADIELIDPVLATRLSPLRSEILLYAASGGARDAVSTAFDISKEAAKKHLAEIYRVMDVRRWDELASALSR